jgi:hypothetical protein
MTWEALIPLGLGLLRSGLGWAENSLLDGRVERWEWLLLAKTELKYCLLFLGGWLAAHGFGVEQEAFAAAGSTLLIDLVSSALQKRKK